MMCIWLQLFTGGSYRRQPNYYYDDGVVSYGAAGRSIHPVSVDILSSKHILPFLAVFLHVMQKKSSLLWLIGIFLCCFLWQDVVLHVPMDSMKCVERVKHALAIEGAAHFPHRMIS
jgi:hypothetical protein